MPRDNRSTTISPEIRERRKIMSRMTPDEKKAYNRKCYEESAKPKLLELIEYCQNNHKICPLPSDWNRICSNYMRYTHRCEFTKFPPFQRPLVLSTWHYSSDVDKRLRLLTQIYWCYKNFGMEFMYSDIMKLEVTDWYKVDIGFPKVSIKDIKKDSRKVVLSIKLLEEMDRDTALKTYGSEASGKNLPFSSLSEDLKKKEEDKE